MEWQKTHRHGDWFGIWLCARKRCCHFDFCTVFDDKRENSFKENLGKNCGIQFFFLVFLSFWTVCDSDLNWSNNRDYVLGKGWLCLSQKKSWLRFWWIIRSVFAKVRLWENQPPNVGKSATDPGKISHRLWENQPPKKKWNMLFRRKKQPSGKCQLLDIICLNISRLKMKCVWVFWTVVPHMKREILMISYDGKRPEHLGRRGVRSSCGEWYWFFVCNLVTNFKYLSIHVSDQYSLVWQL